MITRFALPLVAVAALAVAPLAATAAVPGQTQLKGHITAINGKYGLHVENSKNGNIDAVKMHQGTIINPTGLTLRTGMKVTIVGTLASNGTLDANEIDTPYHETYSYGVGGAPYGYYPEFAGGPFFGGPFFGGGFFW